MGTGSSKSRLQAKSSPNLSTPSTPSLSKDWYGSTKRGYEPYCPHCKTYGHGDQKVCKGCGRGLVPGPHSNY